MGVVFCDSSSGTRQLWQLSAVSPGSIGRSSCEPIVRSLESGFGEDDLLCAFAGVEVESVHVSSRPLRILARASWRRWMDAPPHISTSIPYVTPHNGASALRAELWLMVEWIDKGVTM